MARDERTPPPSIQPQPGPGAGADLPDDALAHAFGGTARAEQPSVLEVLGRLTGEAARVMLDSPVDHTQPVPPVLPLRDGEDAEVAPEDRRYVVLGELARGGVGVVYKSRDKDLGRDVALKVLRRGYAKDKAVVTRFIEEAQIGGQLQHPGIVPVYELGIQPDGRPCFAMKLIKGETLGALLRRRKSAAQDRVRFLRIFEQVCNTVAYAHARNVIHRDLKPANVMVGSFGEVQVVDWGFAKVLQRGGIADERPEPEASAPTSLIQTVRSGEGSAPSVAGSVMGTPAYMPREQAIGDVERMDARSDVFSLGAILCEILTGKPAYVGPDREVLVKAARGDISPALKRLRASGADKALVRIASACLQVQRSARPENAGVVANAMGRYLQAIEDRARRSEVLAAEERVRADAERKARRLTLGLAASVLAAVVLGGGGLWWTGRQQTEREQRAARAVNRVLDEGALLLADARGKPVEDLSGWPAVEASAREAVEQARTREADEDVRARAAAFQAAVEAAAARARAAKERTEADRRAKTHLLSALVESTERADPEHWERSALAVFSEYGIALADLPPDEAGARIAASALAADFVLLLDAWALFRIGLTLPSRLDSDRLHAILRHADPDPWRTKLRAAAWQSDADAVRDLSKPSLDALPTASLLLLGNALGRLGELGRAAYVLRKAYKQTPNRFDAVFSRAYWLTRLERPAWDEALRLFAVASAMHPEVEALQLHAARAHLARGEVQAAIDAWTALRAKHPEDPELARKLADGLTKLGWQHYEKEAWRLAIDAFERAVALEPERAAALAGLARSLGSAGRRRQAIPLYEHALRLDPSRYRCWRGLAIAREVVGDKEGALKAYVEATNLWHALSSRERPASDEKAMDRLAERVAALLYARGGPDDLARIKELLPKIRVVGVMSNYGQRLCKQDPAGGLAIGKKMEEIATTPAERSSALFCQAMSMMKMGRKEQEASIALFREASALQPGGSSNALMNVAYIYMGWEQSDEALVVLREIQKMDRPVVDAWLAAGRILAERGDLAGAIEEYRESVRLLRTWYKGWAFLADALYRAGRHAEAVSAWDRYLRLRPRDEMGYLGKFQALRMKGHTQAARRVLLRPGSAVPESLRPLLRFHAFEDAQDWAPALVALNQAVALDPDNQRLMLEMAWLLVACPDPKLRDVPEALRLIRRVDPRGVTVKFGSLEWTWKPPFIACVKALALLRSGNTEAADRELVRVRADLDDEEGPFAYLVLARVALATGDPTTARAWYEKARKAMTGRYANGRERAWLQEVEAQFAK